MSVPMGRYGAVTGRSFLAWKTDGLGSNSEFRGHKEVPVEVDTLDGLCTRVAFVPVERFSRWLRAARSLSLGGTASAGS